MSLAKYIKTKLLLQFTNQVNQRVVMIDRMIAGGHLWDTYLKPNLCIL